MTKPNIPFDIAQIRGFLSTTEGEALYRVGLQASKYGPLAEIGSYCGKSTVFLGLAAKTQGSILFAIDHHNGSEEHQPGEEYHDSSLFDSQTGMMDSFREFRKTVKKADLEQTVVPIVAPSEVASYKWRTPLSMLFIDGGHSQKAAMIDYLGWSPHIIENGILAIHDIYDTPAEGGQAPREIASLAVASGQFKAEQRIGCLGFFRRLSAYHY